MGVARPPGDVPAPCLQPLALRISREEMGLRELGLGGLGT